MKTRQKSENRIVPEGRGNPSPIEGAKRLRGGKEIPVKEVAHQLLLPFATAENIFCRAEAEGGRTVDRSRVRARKVPKAKVKFQGEEPAMEEVVGNLQDAFVKVAANHGAPGPDRQSIEEVREHFPVILSQLSVQLMEGSYRPGDIRRVWIPKVGGQRGLGIPT